MCGIVAVIHGDPSSGSAAADLHDALYLLQHRGQDACGITTCAAGGRVYQCKGNGMAARVFQEGDRIADLPGFMGLGHLRYPTAGTSNTSEAQPMFVNAPHGLAFTHNGNLVNAPELRRFLDQEAHRHINTDSDSELMLNVFANELNETGKARVNADDCFAALERTYARCKGAWACIAMIAGFGLIAFRDPNGIRPLLLGSRTIDGAYTDYMLASESVALQYFGCSDDDIVDVAPGQAVLLAKGQPPRFHQVVPLDRCARVADIFEFVYLSRPDSRIDGISVYASRRNMGSRLGARVARELGPAGVAEIDVVMPIPETANAAAKQVAAALGKELIDGFVKNRYVFRTFIMPTQRRRRTGVRKKLNAIGAEFRGRTVLLVDDSIVRGTTSKEIVQMAREAGARKVVFASCAPPITHPHIYGIDLASKAELIAFGRSTPEIARAIGADRVVFQTLEDLEAACRALSPYGDVTRFEVGVFTGKYATPIEPDYLDHLERLRGAKKRSQVEERARHAVVNGVARAEDLRVLAGGPEGLARLDGAPADGAPGGGSVAAERAEAETVAVVAATNGAPDAVAVAPEARDMQDISLHNYNSGH